MMAIIALISDFIDLAIKAIGSVFPEAAQAIQQALSQLLISSHQLSADAEKQRIIFLNRFFANAVRV